MSYELTVQEIETYVERYLGYNAGSVNPQQQQDVRRICNSGYRRFLDPSPMDGMEAHKWSFLRAVGDLITELVDAGNPALGYKDEYSAPPDFDSLDGTMTFDEPSRLRTREIRHIHENELRYYQQMTTAGTVTPTQPEYVAVQTIHNDQGSIDYQFVFWPKPTAALTLKFSYYVRKEWSNDRPILGGPTHSETVLAACMAAAERFVNDEIGPHEAMFQERIRASVAADRRKFAGFYGYNGDRLSLDYYKETVQVRHANQVE